MRHPTRAKSAKTPEVAAHIPKGEEVVEDVLSRLVPGQKLEFVSFIEGHYEEYVNGETMRSRALKLEGNLGLADGVYILDHQKELLPKNLQGSDIILPGTLLRDSSGYLSVPCLRYGINKQWNIGFRWFHHDWRRLDRVARCKRPKK